MRQIKKAHTDIAKKQYQKLDDTFELDKIIKEEKPALKKYNRSNLTYNSKYSFHENIRFYSRSIAI